ncbi:YHYH domain-containing protein [Labilibaculum sp.]|uniref:YHYH domain-containing protein n=1 Tax=Labilibaculum sp. TaxID=2060723 RepID=UPI002AA7CE5D|nr:YHYH domain-containing protein [Labilibaculum sp.]
MKNIICSIVILFFLSLNVSGHSGRTDRNGGHYNRKTGKYHNHSRSGLGWGVFIIGGLIIYAITKKRD